MVQCFALLRAAPGISLYEGLPMTEVLRLITGRDLVRCSECKTGTMVRLGSEKGLEDP
jgi:LSD1 subclass zinc finger protein